nr:hypothetical protein [Tanacetum cinerariifolium]
MVRVESWSDDQLTTKMSVMHCMMMSHGGELFARYRRLNQSYHEYVLSTDSRLKGYEEKVANMTGFKLQVSALKKHVSGLNDKLSFADASFAKSKVARLSAALNQATILEAGKDEEILRLKTTRLNFRPSFEANSKIEYAFLNKIFKYGDKPLSTILLFEPKKLVRPANIPIPRDASVSPLITKESTMTPTSKSLELFANFNLTASVVSSEHDEEMVSVEVDELDPKMTDDTITAKSEHAFVQGMSVIFNDSVELVGVGSGRVSSSPNDVMVSLYTSKKGNGLTPSFIASKEAAVNPFGFRFSFFLSFFFFLFLSLFSIRGGARGMPKNTYSSELGANRLQMC